MMRMIIAAFVACLLVSIPYSSAHEAFLSKKEFLKMLPPAFSLFGETIIPAPAKHSVVIVAEGGRHIRLSPREQVIAFCESGGRHYEKNGRVIRGRVDPDDVGFMQINARYHEESARELGLDLETIVGNIAYARKLLKEKGTWPWRSSRPCQRRYFSRLRTH